MGTETRGFASMNAEQRTAMARQGGRAAQAKGNAHTWNSETGRAAGLKSQATRAQKRAQQRAAAIEKYGNIE